MALDTDMPDGDDGGRDWNALLDRVLEPFRSEAAAFRVLLATIAIAGAIIVITLLVRALF
jgi:hypothetical protein